MNIYFPTGIIENPISLEQHIINCQTVIDLVATDVLNVDLSHISGKGIVEGDKVPIRNLLEIFAGFLEYFMECVDDEGMVCHCFLKALLHWGIFISTCDARVTKAL